MVAFSSISAEYGFEVTNVQVVMLCIPACLIGILMAIIYCYRRGLDLDKDPEFQKKLQDPAQRTYIYGGGTTTLDKEISRDSRNAVYIFLGALAIILVISLLKMVGVEILPGHNAVTVVENSASITVGEGVQLTAKHLARAGVVVPGVTAMQPRQISMNVVIQIIMITAAALMIIFCKAKPKAAMQGAVWQNGMVAVVAFYGIAWMSDTYFSNYQPEMQAMLTGIVSQHPWTIAFAFFVVSVLINSQGAVVVSMLPLAYSLGIEGWILLGVMPSVYGYFFIPNYPSDIATVNFDRSGTTVIGKYLLNHSFMIPGLIHVVTATVAGIAISYLYHFVLKLY